MYHVVGTALMAVVVAGCGLVDPDITDFDLRVPPKEVTVDSQQWELTDADTMPDVPCSDMEAVCSNGVDEYCGNEGVCYGSCDGQSCRVTILVSLWNEVDLKNEVPELMEIDEKPLASVTVERIFYSVTENTFNIEAPELTVHVAPQGIMEPGDPQAEQIGTIAPIAAGETFAERDVEIDEEGRAILRSYMKDYTTPFNLLVGTTIELEAGDPIPMGKLVATVEVDAHAGL